MNLEATFLKYALHFPFRVMFQFQKLRKYKSCITELGGNFIILLNIQVSFMNYIMVAKIYDTIEGKDKLNDDMNTINITFFMKKHIGINLMVRTSTLKE